MELNAAFRELVRKIVGLPSDPGAPPQLDRLAHYRARVDTCAANGATVDVTPDDSRIPAKKNVPLRTPAGYVVVLQPGAVVWIGWDRGDPAKMHALPVFESATCSKVIVNSAQVFLGAEAGAKKILTEDDETALIAAISGATAAGGGAAITWTPPTTYGSGSVKAKP